MQINRKTVTAADLLVTVVLAMILWLFYSVNRLTNRLDAMQQGTESMAWKGCFLREDVSGLQCRVKRLEGECWTNVDGATAQR